MSAADRAPRTLPFTKLEGAGNDYVYVDRHDDLEPPVDAAELARRVADRHFGVGSDGLIVLGRSTIADVRMWMWNADGSRGAMCGNGLRCLAKFARDRGVLRADIGTIETDAGTRRFELLRTAGEVVGARVDMGVVRVAAEPTPFTFAGREYPFHAADAGNPHAVVFGDDDPEALPVLEVGAAFQRHPMFASGVNVEFVRHLGGDRLVQRTFERGSGETLACGSGATAVAAAAFATGRVTGDVATIRLRGGELRVIREASSLVLEGPARTVFHGEFLLPEPRKDQ
jgi:diaminopimelate epimerase